MATPLLTTAGCMTPTAATFATGTSATLLEALNRHRGKGQQKVTVEHVHVQSACA
jgi:hypothetical protein